MTEFLTKKAADVQNDPLVILINRIRNGEFTKQELKLREDERVSLGLTVGELIESSFDIGNVHWEGDVLKLGDKPV